jgi:peptidoglycan/xylan/chitin deacetylase (PgdA/CDA1 family)
MSFEVQIAGRLGAPLARAVTRSGARVLMYHRFGSGPDARRLDYRAFADQLAHVARHFHVCSLASLAATLRDGRSPAPGTVVITVDDGYSDFVDYAYPVLQHFELPATLFVVTRFLDGDFWLWFDAMHYLLHATRARSLDITLTGVRLSLDLSSPAAREVAWSAIGDQCLQMDPPARAQAIARLQDVLQTALPPAPSDDYRAMSWTQAASLDARLIDIGSHTCTHPVLSRCSADEIDREVVGSRRTISARLGRVPVAFCYPNGQPEDYDGRCIRAVRSAGYGCATVAHGATVQAGADLYTIQRMATPPDRPQFRRAVDGVTSLADRWRAWRPGTTS